MLLGNKCDMSDRRVVSKERGEKIAVDYQIRFLETSAKANINIDKAFYDLAEAILDKVIWIWKAPLVKPKGIPRMFCQGYSCGREHNQQFD